jgi:hypothetical protein
MDLNLARERGFGPFLTRAGALLSFKSTRT